VGLGAADTSFLSWPPSLMQNRASSPRFVWDPSCHSIHHVVRSLPIDSAPLRPPVVLLHCPCGSDNEGWQLPLIDWWWRPLVTRWKVGVVLSLAACSLGCGSSGQPRTMPDFAYSGRSIDLGKDFSPQALSTSPSSPSGPLFMLTF
jgi:hypothetical protein